MISPPQPATIRHKHTKAPRRAGKGQVTKVPVECASNKARPARKVQLEFADHVNWPRNQVESRRIQNATPQHFYTSAITSWASASSPFSLPGSFRSSSNKFRSCTCGKHGAKGLHVPLPADDCWLKFRQSAVFMHKFSVISAIFSPSSGENLHAVALYEYRTCHRLFIGQDGDWKRKVQHRHASRNTARDSRIWAER